MKCCTKCGEHQPLEDFHRDARKPDGRRADCRKCDNAAARRYHEQNREAALERKRRYYEDNRDRVLAKRKSPEARAQNRMQASVRRARKRNAFVADVDISALYERDCGCCCLCGLPVYQGEAHLEHLMPLALGGMHEPDNCGLAHPACNLRKSAHHPDAFIEEWQDLHDPHRPPWAWVDPGDVAEFSPRQQGRS